MGNHIPLNVGNVVVITSVSLLGIITVMAVTHYLSNRNIPVASPTARGLVSFAGAATGKAN